MGGWKDADQRRAEFCRHLAAMRVGKPLSEEHRQKISAGGKGHKVSKETRAKISAANKGQRRPAVSAGLRGSLARKLWIQSPKGKRHFRLLGQRFGLLGRRAVSRFATREWLATEPSPRVEGALTVEHILPQMWRDHWLLADGSRGLTAVELLSGAPDDPRAQATRRRNAMLQTFGNLTILTQPLNSSVSNSSWRDKKPALLSASLLPINQQLHTYETWDEGAIEQRSGELFQQDLAEPG